MFQRFYDEGLAQASFLIGCDRTNEAVVIDPRRDASVYVEAARQAGARIVAAIETHVHADFVSGARELAAIGARVIVGPGAGLAYGHTEARDGEQLSVGDLRLTFLHTPGHTFEHIAIAATAARQPARLFTGDLLFVGSVGRPDLAGVAQTRVLAGRLFESLRRVARMDPGTEVHPGHGAGSLCGAAIGREPSTTVGREADQNPMMRHEDRDAFIAAVIADVPETPPYFARMKQINKDGPPLLGLAMGPPRLPSITAAAAAALAADGAMIVDLREAPAFASGHPYGAINIGFGSKVGYWAGWVVPADAPVILLASEPAQARDAIVQLLRVGLDRIEGTIAGGFDAWVGAALPVAGVRQILPAAIRAAAADGAIRVVDVRSAAEWRHGHIEGSVNIPVGEIPARAHGLPRERVATICEGGYRSMLAASLLAREGFQDVANVAGGMAACRALETT